MRFFHHLMTWYDLAEGDDLEQLAGLHNAVMKMSSEENLPLKMIMKMTGALLPRSGL